MSLHFVKGDKLKQKSKKFYQEIFLLFSLPKNTFVSHSNLNNEEAAKTYVRMFQASNNNFIWFEQVEKKDEVTYYFGQADEDIINEDKVNILDPLKSSFSITFDLKKINLGNGRFMEDEKGNVFPGIVVNKLNPNQLKLLRNLGLRIVSLKNKKKNEVKYLLIFFNTENHSKSKKVLENLVSNVIFQRDENNNLTIVKIYENNLNQNSPEESAVDQKTSPENIKDSSTINTNHPDSNGSINTDNIIKENLNKTVKSQHNSSFNQQKYKNKWTSPSNTKDYGIQYAAISLRNDGMVLNYKIPLNFKVYEINEICTSHQNGISIKNLSKKYNQPTNIIENIILNEDLGNFDGIIKQWNQEEKSTPDENLQNEFKDSIRERPIINQITNNPYNISEVTNYGYLKQSLNILGFNILEAKTIHELYNDGQNVQDLARKYDFPENKIRRIVLRFDAGDFDKFLVKILKENPSNEDTYLNIQNNTPFNIKIDDDENIFDIDENKESIPLQLKSKDINLILNGYFNNRSITSLSNYFSINYDNVERILNRLIVGDFNEILSDDLKDKLSKRSEDLSSTGNDESDLDDDNSSDLSSSDDNLHDFADEVEKYSKYLHLKNDGGIISESALLSVKVYEIEPIFNSFKNGESVESLSKKFNLTENVIKRTIFNYESGNFDKILSKWAELEEAKESFKSQYKFNDPIRERPYLSESINIPYKISRVSANGHLKMNYHKLDFTILEAKAIHESYNAGQNINEIAKKYGFPEDTIKRIIVRYDAGDFDKFLMEFLKENTTEKGNITKIKNNEAFKNLDINDKGFITFSSRYSDNLSLGLTIPDIKLLFNEYEKNRSIKSLSDNFNMIYKSTKRIINRIIAGDFKNLLSMDYETLIINSILNDNAKEFDSNLPAENRDTQAQVIHFADEVSEYSQTLKLKSDGRVSPGSAPLPVKVYEVEPIFNSFKNGETVESLSKQFNVTEYVIKKTIFNYESGKFDEVIKQWEHKDEELESNKQNGEFEDFIRERVHLTKSVDIPYNKFNVLSNGHLKGKYHELNFTILDARNMHESYNVGQTIDDLAKLYDFTDITIKRIIVRYDAGDFNDSLIKVLKENPSDEETNLYIKNNTPFKYLEKDNNGNIFNKNLKGQHLPLNLNEKDINKIFSEYKNNKSIKSLSAKFNMDYDDMERIINRIIVGDFKQIPLIKEESLNNNISISNEDIVDSSKDVKETSRLSEINEKINFILNYYDNILGKKSENTDIIKELNNQANKFNNQEDSINNLNNVNNYKTKEPVSEIEEEKPSIVRNSLNHSEEPELSTEINELKDQIEKLKIINKEKVSANDKLILENQKTSELYAQKIKNLKDSLEDVNNLKIRINTLKDENYNLRRENKNKSNDLENLKTEIEDLENMNSNINSLNNVESDNVNSLKTEIEDLKNHNKEKSDEIENLIKENNKHIFERNNNINELNDYRYKFEELDNQIKKLKRENSHFISKNSDLNISINEKADEIEELDDQIKKLKRENSNLNTVNKEKSDEIERMVVENKEATNNYDQKINDFNDSLAEYDKLKSQNEDLKKINKTLTEKFDKLVEDNKKSELEYTHKINNLKSQSSNHEDNGDLISEIDILKSENSDLKTANNNQNWKIDKLVMEHKKISEAYDQKINDLYDTLKEINQLKNDIDNLKAVNKNQSDEIKVNKTVEQKLIQRINDLKVSSGNQEQNKELLSEIDILKNQNEDLKKINKTLTEKFDKLVEDNKKSELEYTHKINNLKSQSSNQKQNKRLLSEIDDLKTLNNEKSEGIDKLQSEIDILKSENSNLKIFNKNKIKELGIEKDKNEKINNELQETKKEFNNLESKFKNEK